MTHSFAVSSILTKPPECFFDRIEQCQEIQVLARTPYSDTQVINNAVRLLMQSSIFPLKEFDEWQAITPKTYPALKTFISTAYTRRLLSQQLCSTAGQMRYTPQTQNMYAVLDDDDVTTGTDRTTTTITNLAAMTKGSTLTTAQATVIPDLVANTINQLSANQTAMMSQMAAMNLNYRVSTQAT